MEKTYIPVQTVFTCNWCQGAISTPCRVFIIKEEKLDCLGQLEPVKLRGVLCLECYNRIELFIAGSKCGKVAKEVKEVFVK